jgi:threonine dehydrogenase-like Zn-dependent dehydrogenase
MLAAVTQAPGALALEDVPPPGPPGPGDVVLRPEVVGICGSDLHVYSGDAGALSGPRTFFPRVQGHEFSAIIEATGPLRPGIFPDKEIDVAGSSCATAADFRAATQLVRAHRTAIAALPTHRFPLAEARDAIECAANSPPDVIKVLVTITGNAVEECHE